VVLVTNVGADLEPVIRARHARQLAEVEVRAERRSERPRVTLELLLDVRRPAVQGLRRHRERTVLVVALVRPEEEELVPDDRSAHAAAELPLAQLRQLVAVLVYLATPFGHVVPPDQAVVLAVSEDLPRPGVAARLRRRVHDHARDRKS